MPVLDSPDRSASPGSPGSSAVRSRGAALAVLSAGTLMIILDGTIVNVALPSIQRDLGFSQANLAWVVNAYLIAFAGLLLLSGRLGDLLGRRRVLVGGLAAFTLASFLCGIADSAGLLIAARFVQGAAGAMVSAVALGMVLALYPDPHGRARAMGIYSFTQSAGGVLGLLAGGILTQAINWHWIFFVNLPIGLAATVLSLRLLPDDRPAGAAGSHQAEPDRGLRGVDVSGAVLVTAALMLGVYTIVKTTDRGWTSGSTAGFGAAALVLLAAFLIRQARAAQPLMPLRIFRSRIVAGANAVQVLVIAGGFGFQFMTSLYLQHVLGYDPLEIGLSLAPTGVVIGVMSLGLSARLGARFGQRAVLLPSLVLFAGGFLLLARTPSGGHASYVADILPPIVLMGVAFGLTMPSLLTLGMAEAGPADSGLISGVFNTAQQIGGALGLATLASIAGTRTDHRLAAGRSATAALADGYHLAFVVAAGLLVAAALLAGVLLRTPAGRTAGDLTTAGEQDADGPAVSSSPGTRPAPGRSGRTARV
ncbi:drug resistance transporter, EmrB/QacA subfamily [Actinacidiphila yanglinensis]|uniref:Drug resistance transporter, EmrB/QacA subfamily n=1 Tax=Actinacidiphila yanglinensis TaxID=310779 RepID=A0A1H6A8J5_9ACTN|nr:DHA2 family efflux MFS transporter permease subunit [Actinacidiphila yanglinensis]SEG44692.1 drug resistance transporter, EmrB/QacA subfamily [Actinacidiphila yanglinensis]